jgi:hypothetical protein
MNELAIWTVYGWIGWALVTVLQLAAWGVSTVVGKKLFRRLIRIYHLSVLSYWLDRLEKEGRRTFQRAQDGDEDG